MTPRLVDGWLVVECDAPPNVPVHIAVGDGEDWRPAFRDVVDGRPVAKVRPPAVTPGATLAVQLRVGEQVTALRPIRP